MKKKRIEPPKITLVEWLRLVEFLIGTHSTKPRTRGKHKGHASTNSCAWVADLALVCERYIRRRNRGRAYDENMALASLLGFVLASWYCNVRRAKGFDPNRPLARRVVFRHLAKYRGDLAAALADDRLMGAVWGKGQAWNFPFGRGARGGKFV